MDYLEIVKFLHKDQYVKNPPSFNDKLMTIERLDSVMKFDQFLSDDEFNKTLFLTYITVRFNWLMKDILAKIPDLYDLTNLQFKVKIARNKFDFMSNHYLEMIHIFLSSIAIYYCDKSSESLIEFNQSVGKLLSNVSEFWNSDFRQEFMKSKAPDKFLSKNFESSCSCNSCECR